jgi:hypothetical protein
MKITIREESEFLSLVNKEIYQVFLFSSKCPFPFPFARHYWFVENQKGNLRRIEVFNTLNKKSKLGYFRNSDREFSKALNKYLLKKELHWKESQIENIIDGEYAKKLIWALEDSITNYPFKDKYCIYPGPNSNTFAQWILNKIPELKIKLSWNSFGKDYWDYLESFQR